MKSIKNVVQLIGNVGKEPALKKFDKGGVKVSFSLATHDSYKNEKGEYIEETQWHNIVAWGPVASIIAEDVDKGAEVLVSGKLTHRRYEDNNDVVRYFTEVKVNSFVLLNKPAKPQKEAAARKEKEAVTN